MADAHKKFFLRFYGPGASDRACKVIYFAYHVRGHKFETEAQPVDVSVNMMLPPNWEKLEMSFIFESEKERDAFRYDKEVLELYKQMAAPEGVGGVVELRQPGDAAFAL